MMRKKIGILFFTAIVAGAVLMPVYYVRAVSPIDGPVVEIKAEIAAFLQDLLVLKDRFAVPAIPGSTEALARLDLLRQFQTRMQTLRTRIADLAVKVQGSKQLEKGMKGEGVFGLQKFLKQFPDIYPEGLETGFFGPATERAIKKLQKQLGIEETGSIGPKTQDKLDELSRATARKTQPKITGIMPGDISITTKVTLTGNGFTLENNSLFVRGRTILTGLTSHDGTEIVFSLPAEIPCTIGQACPLKIVNSNGISNAKVFKLVDLVTPPTEDPPVPPPPPAPAPPPPPALIPPPPPAPAPAPACISGTLNVPEKYSTIQGAIDAVTCPGTIIQIAAGTYYEILVMKSDITIVGAGPGMTIIDGSKTPATVNPFGYLVQNFNVITAGKLGYGLQNIQIKNLSITGSGAYGDNAAIRIQDSSNVLVENVLLYKNTDGLRIYSSSPVTAKNVTMVGSRNGVMSHGATEVTIKNSIITQNSGWGLYAADTGVQLASAYNDVFGNGTNYDKVASVVGDISLDPKLGGAPQYLVATSSLTIDAGDPADAYLYEPLPNCGRINMGSYGNSQWATTCFVPDPAPAPAPPPLPPPPPPAAPAITSISPSYGNTGTAVKINGTGFTASGNEVHFTGAYTNPHAIVSNVASSDGVTFAVAVPSDLPCSELSECSLFVKI